MHLAVGTSFSIIIPTSIVSVLTHKKHKSVDLSMIKNYGIFVIIGVLSGTIFSSDIEYQISFIVFYYNGLFLGAYLFFFKDKTIRFK